MRRASRGAALAVSLILLLGLSLLAIAGIASAVASLALAGFEEQSALAFEAAEAGVARTIRLGTAVREPVAVWPTALPGVTVRTETVMESAGAGPGWPEGFSIGGGAFALDHFTIRAEGRASRGAVVRVEQDMAVVAATVAEAP